MFEHASDVQKVRIKSQRFYSCVWFGGEHSDSIRRRRASFLWCCCCSPCFAGRKGELFFTIAVVCLSLCIFFFLKRLAKVLLETSLLDFGTRLQEARTKDSKLFSKQNIRILVSCGAPVLDTDGNFRRRKMKLLVVEFCNGVLTLL